MEKKITETNNSERVDDIEKELENKYRPTEDVMSLIKEQTSDILIKEGDIKNLTKILKEWNECILKARDPKTEFEEIKIGNFTLSYKEFKSLVDNKLLSTQYYTSPFMNMSKLRGKPISEIDDLDILEANLDIMMPSMSKDGIFNMMTYNLAKNSSVSDKVELHYVDSNTDQSEDCLAVFKNLNNNIIEESKTDGKIHFIVADKSRTEEKVNGGHVTPYIIVGGDIFEFDSVSSLGIGDGYATRYLQQTDSTSCKTIAIREVDNFLKILGNFDSIEEFFSYLKQFFSENKIEYYIDSSTNSLMEGPKEGKNEKERIKNRRLAILPFPILKNSQSISSLRTTLEYIENLDKKYKKILLKNKKKKFKKKYGHILGMKNKLDKSIKKFGIKKKISKDVEANVNVYALKERLRQAKTLAILLEKGKIKSLGEVEGYINTKKGEAAVATVDKELVKEINNKTEDNIKNRKNRIELKKNNSIENYDNIKPFLKGIEKTTKYDIDDNPIHDFYKSVESKNKCVRHEKKVKVQTLESFIDKMPKNVKNELKNILSSKEIRKKLDEMGKNLGIEFGTILANALNNEHSRVL